MSEALPHLVLDGFTSKLGARVANILKYLFPVPKDDRRARGGDRRLRRAPVALPRRLWCAGWRRRRVRRRLVVG